MKKMLLYGFSFLFPTKVLANSDTAGCILPYLFIGVFVFGVLFFPVAVAYIRGVSEERQNRLALLCVFSFFFGITWIIAMILACTYPTEEEEKEPIIKKEIIKVIESVSLADLERLAKLKESGILTDEEFEIEKEKILSRN